MTSLLLLFAFIPNAKAQDEEESSWNAGLDIYSSYIWRGAKFGNGPAFQPAVSFATGGFEIGAWGSVSSSLDEGYEMDLYSGYSFELSENSSLGINLTDYYFGGDWTSGDNHFIEPNVSLGLGGFSIMGAYMFMPDGYYSANGDENKGDIYLEAGYSFEHFSLGLAAGEGQYTAADQDVQDPGNPHDRDRALCQGVGPYCQRGVRGVGQCPDDG